MWNQIVKNKSFLSVALEGANLAKIGYSDRSKKVQLKEQRKYFFRFFFNPSFASEWLENLKMDKYSDVIAHRKLLFIKPFREYVSIKWTKKQKAKVILDTYRFIMSKGLDMQIKSGV